MSDTNLNLIGATLLAIRTAANGLLLSFTLPRPNAMCLPETLHIGIFPAAGPSADLPELILRTHRGPLPSELEALAEPLMPELFAPVLGQPISFTAPPPDGSNGFILGFDNEYAVRIDMTGINLMKQHSERPEATNGTAAN